MKLTKKKNQLYISQDLQGISKSIFRHILYRYIYIYMMSLFDQSLPVPKSRLKLQARNCKL